MKLAGRMVLFLGALYFVTGVALGALAGQAASDGARSAWRWSAWLVSIVAFTAHVAYGVRRLHNTPAVAALHAAAAAALGSFGLAVAANVHALRALPVRPPLLLVLSLVLWPVITALPAFVVALVLALLMARLWRSA